MTDIATLGIKIDSTDATKATTALSGLAAAAKPATTAATALAAATHDAATAHSAMSTQSMAAFHSMRSMTEGFAAGQPVTQMLAQQLNHLSYAASGPGGLVGAFKGALGAFSGLLSPAILIGGGLLAVAAAGSLATLSIIKTEKAFDDVSRAAGTTVTEMHGLESAASFKGIDTTAFLGAMEKFGHSVYEAKNDMGGLADVFRANNAHASDFNGYLFKAADLIKNASSDQQRLTLLQQMGLPATMEWVRFLSQGKEGLTAAIKEATAFGGAADEKLIAKAREFDEAWAKSWKNFTTSAKSGLLSVLDGFDTFDSKLNALLMKLPLIGKSIPSNILRSTMDGSSLTTGSRLTANSNVDDFYKGTGAGLGNAKPPPPTVDRAALLKTIQDEQTRIGILGQTASIEDTVRQVELQIQRARLDGVEISAKEEAGLKRLAEDRALGITQMKDSSRTLRLEADTAGMSVGEQQRYLAAQIAINGARRDGKPLSEENIARINAEATALGRAAQHADDMKWGYTNLVQGPMQAFRSALVGGATFFDSLKKAGASALDSISSKLMDMAAQNLWKNALGGGGGGGLLSLFGLGGGDTRPGAGIGDAGLIGPTLPGNASGTDNWRGGLTQVNEKGGEIMNLPSGTQIIPHDVSMAMANRVAAPTASNDNAGGNVNAPITINIDATGADAAGLDRVNQQLASLKAELPGRVVAAVTQAKKERRL